MADTAAVFAAANVAAFARRAAEAKAVTKNYIYDNSKSHYQNLQAAGRLMRAEKAQEGAAQAFIKLNPKAKGGDPRKAAATNLAITANTQRKGGLSPIKGGRPSATTLISDPSVVGKKKNALGTKQY